MNLQNRALRIAYLIDLLLLIYDVPAGMNLNKIIGKKPGHGSGVSIVRGIEPNVIHDRDRFSNILFLGFFSGLSERDGPGCDYNQNNYCQPIRAAHSHTPWHGLPELKLLLINVLAQLDSSLPRWRASFHFVL